MTIVLFNIETQITITKNIYLDPNIIIFADTEMSIPATSSYPLTMR